MKLRRAISGCLVALSAVSLCFAGLVSAQARELSFDGRVTAQKAIEQVYWSHRIWPKENPGPKPPLSAVMSDRAIRAKVEDYLKKSNALETWWQRPVTAQQLQAELDRMASNTRDGETLQELYRALGNDPFVIAETLGRQTLVDRLVQSWYANDSRIHAGTKAKAEAALARCANVDCMKTMGGEYHEATSKLDDNDVVPPATVGELEESPEAFVVTAARERRDGEIITRSVVWPKPSFDSWWAKERVGTSAEVVAETRTYSIAAPTSGGCVNDTWADTQNEPPAREGQSTVWTGTEMIIWGGANPLGALGGGRYNPSTDSWTTMPPNPSVPSAFGLPAVWTGTEMIVWGGLNGGRYSPSTDAWSLTSNIPTPRSFATAVWTGTEMIVWGGAGYTNTGARYRPSTDSWTPTSSGANVPSPRAGHDAVWTGTEMIIYGGQAGGPIFFNGGRYNPSTDGWAAMTPALPTLANMPYGPAVWTGTEMIVWGGTGGTTGTGGRYNPSTDGWSATSTGVNAPSYRRGHTLVWTGTEMIAWGGELGSSFNTGGRYNPATNTWTPTSTGANVPVGRSSHTAVWTGTELIVWGGVNNNTGYLRSGGRFNPSTDSWVPTQQTSGDPSSRNSSSAVWTGTEMIVWGGSAGTSSGNSQNSGSRYNPSTDTWTPTSTGAGVPPPRSNHTAVWTGTEMIVWGGAVGASGGRYDPSTDTWLATSEGANVPSARSAHTAVWTGTEMIIWGGSTYNTGGRYNPSTNTWTPTSEGANVPLGRSSHTAVWTGTEMVIWGGNTYNTGGRYNPSTDSWTPTSVGVNTPTGRKFHTAVWTGMEMIVWGGDAPFAVNAGGRYSPVTDSWAATSIGANVPAARDHHTATWTGAEMIVWGGNVNGASSLNSGGRYNPATDGWLTTSTGANVPTARYDHTAVWTGSRMIVWGGGSLAVNPGIYCACPSGLIVYRDADGDGYGNGTSSTPACDGTIPAGFAADGTDCDDTNPGVHPGAVETCNGLDDNCDNTVDNGASALCPDSDACTHDVCGGTSGCSNAFDPGPCDDGILCTNGDNCSTGSCVGVVGPPPEINGVSAAGHVTTTLSWTGLGGGTTYDLMTSTLSDLSTNATAGATCLANDVPGPSFVDTQPNPAAGAGYYYLIRAQNICGNGGYGFDSGGFERLPAAPCP